MDATKTGMSVYDWKSAGCSRFLMFARNEKGGCYIEVDASPNVLEEPRFRITGTNYEGAAQDLVPEVKRVLDGMWL